MPRKASLRNAAMRLRVSLVFVTALLVGCGRTSGGGGGAHRESRRHGRSTKAAHTYEEAKALYDSAVDWVDRGYDARDSDDALRSKRCFEEAERRAREAQEILRQLGGADPRVEELKGKIAQLVNCIIRCKGF